MTVEQIREYVDAYIKKNGKRAITGAILNLALQEIVDELASYVYTEQEKNSMNTLRQKRLIVINN
jgi:NTP pyrophosphatase (non-canonical NTP hydrolase)